MTYNKPRMRVVPRRPSQASASIQAHTYTQTRLPFTQPTMRLSFKLQSRNLRGLAIGLPGSLRMQPARERSVTNLLPADIRLFFLRVSLVAGRRCTFRSRNLRGLARRSAFERMQALAIDRSRTCAAGFANPLRGEVTCVLARV